ncbi:MAG: diaminopimelate decarboxylase [Planctomycetaceae bacterium]|nr:diaminopimelate decarboxylase [Planctomycetaceae bacterium]
MREKLRVDIAGHAITDLVSEFGTPLYVYDEAPIRRRVEQLACFDTIRYAQKACSHLAILAMMRQAGVLVDAVSAGELLRAIEVGYTASGDPPPIVYTADIFDRPALDLCRDLGIHVNAGSPDMIQQWGELAPGQDMTLRINPGFGHGHSQKTNTGGEHSKHGIWLEQLEDCLVSMDQYGMAVTGVHMHIGSGSDWEHLSQVCQAMESAVETVGRTVRTISTGGGLSIPYHPDDAEFELEPFYERWSATQNRLQDRLGHSLRMEVEPGRFLVAESGYLIAEIRAVKQMGGNLFYLVDAGFNDLARPILYGAYHPMSVAPANGRPAERRVHEVVVGGPLCESGDIFTQTDGGFVQPRPLPTAGVGDFLVLESAGAYGQVMASNYNSKPLAAAVLLRDQQRHLIRRRQTLADMWSDEQLLPSETRD